jgi:hypothetical protein
MEPDVTAALAIIGVVVSVGGSILAVINHTRVRSVCCGNKLEVSLDVEKTTPPGEKLEIKVPADKSVAKLDV